MMELALAIVTNSSSGFAFVVLVLCALPAVLGLGGYVWRANVLTSRGKSQQLHFEHEEKMAELYARHPQLLGHDVSPRLPPAAQIPAGRSSSRRERRE